MVERGERRREVSREPRAVDDCVELAGLEVLLHGVAIGVELRAGGLQVGNVLVRIGPATLVSHALAGGVHEVPPNDAAPAEPEVGVLVEAELDRAARDTGHQVSCRGRRASRCRSRRTRGLRPSGTPGPCRTCRQPWSR